MAVGIKVIVSFLGNATPEPRCQATSGTYTSTLMCVWQWAVDGDHINPAPASPLPNFEPEVVEQAEKREAACSPWRPSGSEDV